MSKLEHAQGQLFKAQVNATMALDDGRTLDFKTWIAAVAIWKIRVAHEVRMNEFKGCE